MAPRLPVEQQAQANKKNTAPLVAKWKTSIVASAFGLIAGFAVPVLAFIFGDGWVGVRTACLALWVIDLIYAILVYPTLFSRSPLLSHSGVASFCNLFFGGVIFGPFWNWRLTTGKQGVSYAVFCLLLTALAFLMCCIPLIMTTLRAMPFNSINELGEVGNDGTSWESFLIYSTESSEMEQYWDVFNNHACWALAEFAEVEYDVAHEFWCEVAEVEERTGEISQETVQIVKAKYVATADTPPPKSGTTDKCTYEGPHIRVYKGEFELGNTLYEMGIVHCFLHDGGEQPLSDHGGERSPWFYWIKYADN